MSGICGVVAFDGETPVLGPILRRLERRGPDGTQAWSDGPVALGHTLLATTPEALVEVLPLTDPESGCTITADARLDNREALIGDLGLGGEAGAIGDGELILRAYVKWSEDCPRHLLGDFAFAIWDPGKQRLFCARDHMGMRQLIYHHAPGRLFAFATEAEAVVAHPAVPQRINEGRIADFLDGLEAIDLTSTFFEEVVRLPPAHTLAVDRDGLRLDLYWQLTAGPELKLASDEAYSAAFLEVFTEAVRCRLRSAGPVGSMLSGGMDSNSVSAVAARLLAADGRGPLATFSATGPDPENCVETRAIRAALAPPGYCSSLINHADLEEYRSDLIRLAQTCAEPFDGTMTLVRGVYLSAHRRGVNVMLDGAGGDVILTAGNRVSQLLRDGKIRAALLEARSEKRFWHQPVNVPRDFLAAAWAAFVPERLRFVRRQLLWRFQDRRARVGRGRIAKGFARSVDLAGRRQRFRLSLGQGLRSGTEIHPQFPGHARLILARERYDRVASALAIEPRDPFLDLRVVQFCLTLPAAQLQSGGWPKTILRRAMAGMIPPEVIWRRGKEHLGWTFTQALIGHWNGGSARIPGDDRLFRYVSPAALTALAEEPSNAMDTERRFELIVLSCWLARNQVVGESFSCDGE